MSLRHFQATNFRCLTSISLEVDAQYNLIYGHNASGKTSILEAIAYLGRGKSFRGARLQNLIYHGATEFLLFGKVDVGTRLTTMGIRSSKDGIELKIDGGQQRSAASLVEMLPLQIVDPEVHNLVVGGPEGRRRYLDWIAFHVERGYRECWRRFCRALRQRNAALRQVANSRASIIAWDQEFLEAAEQVDQTRRRVLELTYIDLQETGTALLGCAVDFEYLQGWSSQQSLKEALAVNWERDCRIGTTSIGPQRAELRLIYNERHAKYLVSRGQQKLLACAMIFAATKIVQATLQRPLLLLLDDPAAELDEEAFDRLMKCAFGLRSQIIATALTEKTLRFPATPALFHVEHGKVKKKHNV